jgi:hypothetical protein
VGVDCWQSREKPANYFALNMVDTPKQDAPLTVSLGVLTQAEYDQLSADLQADLDLSTRELQARYGSEWLTKERDRLREELSFFYGVP